MEFSIETTRLIARQFSTTDAEAFFQMTRDPDIQAYLPGTCSPDTIEEMRNVIKTIYSQCDFQHDFYLLIEEKETHAVVGFVEITQNPFDSYFDCCYCIDKSYRRRGYLKEILPAFIERVYFPGRKIYFFIEPGNIPSINFIKQIPGMLEVADNDYNVFLYQDK